MKPFLINTSHGDIGVQPTGKENEFFLCVVDGHTVVAKKDRTGKWYITNGKGHTTSEMLKHAEHIGELIDGYIERKCDMLAI